MCYLLAKHCFFYTVTAEEDEEIFIGEEQTEENLHQLKHREVFLSRQLEIINANTIRYKFSPPLFIDFLSRPILKLYHSNTYYFLACFKINKMKLYKTAQCL